MRLHLSVLLVLILQTATGQDIQKPVINVAVDIEVQEYIDVYPVEQVAAQAGSDLATALSGIFKFADFVADSAAAAHQLNLTLSKNVPLSIGSSPQASMWIVLSDEDGDTIAYGGEQFVSIQTILPDEWDAFADLVVLHFTNWVNSNKHDIIEQVFSQVKVSNSALPLPESGEWVLTWNRHNLELDENSRLSIRTSLSSALRNDSITYHTLLTASTTTFATAYPASYRGKSIAKIEDVPDPLEQNELIDKMRESGLKVEGIYLRSIRPASLSTTNPNDRPIGP